MRLRKLGATLLLYILTVSLVGCSAKNEHTEEIIETIEEVVEEITPEDVETEITLEDMSGRTVTIPKDIGSVYGTNNNSTILLYTLADDKMIGWNLDFSDKAKKYIKQNVQELPVLGNMYGNGKKANPEEILGYKPDIALITDTKMSDKVVEAADKMQSQLGIPVVVVIANINNFDDAYIFLGEVLGVEDRAQELAEYYIETYDNAVSISATIDEKATVYYAREDSGLTTEFKGSPNAELIELVGAENVALIDEKMVSGEVSIEQVMEWNPEIILIGHKGAKVSAAYELIMSDELWQSTTAGSEGAVISTPRFPFNWFDRPPSVNRIIGIKWLGNAIYPDIYAYDMVKEVKDFFQLYYGVEITDEDVKSLMK